MKSLTTHFYPHLPVFIQNIGISAYGYQWNRRRFGGVYREFLEEARLREFYTTDQWAKYQTEKLRRLLSEAFEYVPFYFEKYSKAGFTKEDLINFEISDLKNLPFLEKDELRRYGTTSLLSTKKSKGIYISSSGSSGTPTKIYLPKYFHQQWSALMEARVRNWAGVDRYTPRGMIGGRRIIPDASIKMPLYRYNFVEKQTYFSAYHISPSTAENYVEGMIKHRVEYMTGYAMSNFLLAKFIEEKGIAVPKMKAVITSSEKLTAEMRSTLERVYQCRVFDSYSGCEACGLISESPEGKLLFNPDSGIMEIIKEDGSYAEPGEMGEIILTGLHNFDQPLIRYRIGDMVKLSKNQSPVGGRYMPVIDEITGRIEDVIVGRDGRSMVRFHSLYIDIPGLKAAQLIQHDYESFTFKLLIDKGHFLKEYGEATIKNRLYSQIGNVEVSFEYPEKIPVGSNGKIKAVISEIKN